VFGVGCAVCESLTLNGYVSVISEIDGKYVLRQPIVNITCSGDCSRELCKAINTYESTDNGSVLLHLEDLQNGTTTSQFWTEIFWMIPMVWNGVEYVSVNGQLQWCTGTDNAVSCPDLLNKFLAHDWHDITIAGIAPHFINCPYSDSGSD
jgi:hypothetical protein